MLAAERGGLQARAHRAASLHALLARWGLPGLLAHALSPNSAAAAAALPGAPPLLFGGVAGVYCITAGACTPYSVSSTV